MGKTIKHILVPGIKTPVLFSPQKKNAKILKG
jgi:hypothetical protein